MSVRKYWTWLQVKTKIMQDLDLEEETFVRPSELLEYANEAIDETEAEIHTLNQDYFLKEAVLPMVSGQNLILAPSDLFGHMIREVVFDDGGSEHYRMKRLVDPEKLIRARKIDRHETMSNYQWYMVNQAAGQLNLRITPYSRHTGSFCHIQYIRQANRIELDTDILDLPECYGFIFQKIKCSVYEKEGHPNFESSLLRLEKMRDTMQGTLANAIPDNENLITADLSIYREME